MWRPGQLITIRGIVYRVKRIDHNSKVLPCNRCIFQEWSNGCVFPKYKGKYNNCIDLIPDDCYFQRVSPIIVIK
jgi:hypothetical protein